MVVVEDPVGEVDLEDDSEYQHVAEVHRSVVVDKHRTLAEILHRVAYRQESDVVVVGSRKLEIVVVETAEVERIVDDTEPRVPQPEAVGNLLAVARRALVGTTLEVHFAVR